LTALLGPLFFAILRPEGIQFSIPFIFADGLLYRESNSDYNMSEVAITSEESTIYYIRGMFIIREISLNQCKENLSTFHSGVLASVMQDTQLM